MEAKVSALWHKVLKCVILDIPSGIFIASVALDYPNSYLFTDLKFMYWLYDACKITNYSGSIKVLCDLCWQEECEVLRSIYEGDERFKEVSPVVFQYRVVRLYCLCTLVLGVYFSKFAIRMRTYTAETRNWFNKLSLSYWSSLLIMMQCNWG